MLSADPENRIKAFMTRHRRFFSDVQGKSWAVFRIALLFGLSFILLYPLLYMISVSFRDMKDVFDPSVIWVSKNWTIQNYKEVVQVMTYWKALGTSAEINIVSSLIQVLICAVTGYGFARFNFRFKNLIFALVLVTIIVPPHIIITPMYMNFKSFDYFGVGYLLKMFGFNGLETNLLNTSWVFYLPAVFGQGIKSGLFVYIFRQSFSSLPKELEDAAHIDGAGFGRSFWTVMLPNVRPAILLSVVLSLVWYWNDYYLGSMLINNHQTVTMQLVSLPQGLRLLSGYETAVSDPYKLITHMQAGSLLTIAPVLIFYLVIQKYFVQGVERSGLVG